MKTTSDNAADGGNAAAGTYIERALAYIRRNKSRIEEAAEAQKQVWEGGRPDEHPLLLSRDDPPPEAYGEPAEGRPDGGTARSGDGSPEAGDFARYMSGIDPESIHYDSEKMFLSELDAAVRTVAGGMQAVPSVRANMGCGIIPTLFGVKQELFKDKMPWIQKHLSREAVERTEPCDLVFGDEFNAGISHMDYMAERLAGTGCRVYPMDIQGPFDTAHLVYGDDIFYDLYDDPGFIRHLMELSRQAVCMGMDECIKHIPDAGDGICHYNNLAMPRSAGGIKLSEDTVTLLSKAHVEEYAAPYIVQVLERYGGGYVHYCGRNPHLYDALMDMPLVRGINFGNPEMHDMDAVLKDCAARGIIYYGAVPRGSGESLGCYFSRCVSSASAEGRIRLLLTYRFNADGGESLDDIRRAWQTACRPFAS